MYSRGFICSEAQGHLQNLVKVTWVFWDPCPNTIFLYSWDYIFYFYEAMKLWSTPSVCLKLTVINFLWCNEWKPIWCLLPKLFCKHRNASWLMPAQISVTAKLPHPSGSLWDAVVALVIAGFLTFQECSLMLSHTITLVAFAERFGNLLNTYSCTVPFP